MRIVVLQDDLPPHHVGGGGIIAYQIAKEFVRLGHEVLAITTVQRLEDAGRESVDGIDVVRLYSDYHPRYRAYRSLYNPSVVKAVRRLLRDFSPDVVHVHNVHTHLSYASLIAARRFGRRVVMTEHDAMSFHFGKLPTATDPNARELPQEAYRESLTRQIRMYRWRFNPFRTFLIRHILHTTVDATVAVSDALAHALQANEIHTATVIHNGIRVGEWDKPNSGELFKKKYTLKGHVILFGGRLSEPKGAIKAIEAFPEIVRRVPDAQLLVIGKRDAFTERMARLASILGVEKHIAFAGWISGEELKSAYHAASVVVVPSIYLDPFPTVNLEAFAAGKPVVATCFGGSSEIVEDVVSGYVVNPLDVDALSGKVADLLTDGEKAERFGAAGHSRVVCDFTLTGQARAYEKLFTELA